MPRVLLSWCLRRQTFGLDRVGLFEGHGTLVVCSEFANVAGNV